MRNWNENAEYILDRDKAAALVVRDGEEVADVVGCAPLRVQDLEHQRHELAAHSPAQPGQNRTIRAGRSG